MEKNCFFKLFKVDFVSFSVGEGGVFFDVYD